MLENDFSTANRSPKEDSSQINEHLDNMSIDELTDALTDMWDATDDLTYSAAWMDECLKKIDQIEDAPEFDVDASLNNFLSKHSRLVECASRTSENSSPKTSRWKSPVAAVVAILVVLGSMVTAQALGIDVFGTIARWTNEPSILRRLRKMVIRSIRIFRIQTAILLTVNMARFKKL